MTGSKLLLPLGPATIMAPMVGTSKKNHEFLGHSGHRKLRGIIHRRGFTRINTVFLAFDILHSVFDIRHPLDWLLPLFVPNWSLFVSN